MIPKIGRGGLVVLAASAVWALPGCERAKPGAEAEAPGAEAEAPRAEASPEPEPRDARIWAAGEGDRFWVFPESRDHLGSGGEFHVYVDAETMPEARASFARYDLGVGGALPEHRHDRTEEIAYFVSGQGVARLFEAGEPRDVAVGPGSVWYNPPGAWHAITNTGDEPLVLVFATIPNEEKGLLSFFRRISVRPGEEPVSLPPEEFGRIAAEHDLILRPAPEAPSEP